MGYIIGCPIDWYYYCISIYYYISIDYCIAITCCCCCAITDIGSGMNLHKKIRVWVCDLLWFFSLLLRCWLKSLAEVENIFTWWLLLQRRRWCWQTLSSLKIKQILLGLHRFYGLGAQQIIQIEWLLNLWSGTWRLELAELLEIFAHFLRSWLLRRVTALVSGQVIKHSVKPTFEWACFRLVLLWYRWLFSRIGFLLVWLG